MKILGILISLLFLGCRDADIASRNLSYAADNFEIMRRVVFYNGINGKYILSIEGLCSFEHSPLKPQVSVTCKKSKTNFIKHTLGLSDNVTYFSEQMESAPVGTYHYKVIFKPQTILPNIDFKGSLSGN